MSGWNSHGWNHRGHMHHGYRPRHMGMPGLSSLGILIPIVLVIFISLGLRFGGVFFIVLLLLWVFKSGTSKSYGGWRGGEWSHDSSVDEKRKNDEDFADDKLKRTPTYVGDDGELTDKPKHAAGDDIYYI